MKSTLVTEIMPGSLRKIEVCQLLPILELISEFTTAVFSSPIILVTILASLLMTLITDSPAGSGMVHDLPVLSILLGLSGVISAAPPCPAHLGLLTRG